MTVTRLAKRLCGKACAGFSIARPGGPDCPSSADGDEPPSRKLHLAGFITWPLAIGLFLIAFIGNASVELIAITATAHKLQSLSCISPYIHSAECGTALDGEDVRVANAAIHYKDFIGRYIKDRFDGIIAKNIGWAVRRDAATTSEYDRWSATLFLIPRTVDFVGKFGSSIFATRIGYIEDSVTHPRDHIGSGRFARIRQDDAYEHFSTWGPTLVSLLLGDIPKSYWHRHNISSQLNLTTDFVGFKSAPSQPIGLFSKKSVPENTAHSEQQNDGYPSLYVYIPALVCELLTVIVGWWGFVHGFTILHFEEPQRHIKAIPWVSVGCVSIVVGVLLLIWILGSL
jgi:hypothetical protein